MWEFYNFKVNGRTVRVPLKKGTAPTPENLRASYERVRSAILTKRPVPVEPDSSILTKRPGQFARNSEPVLHPVTKRPVPVHPVTKRPVLEEPTYRKSGPLTPQEAYEMKRRAKSLSALKEDVEKAQREGRFKSYLWEKHLANRERAARLQPDAPPADAYLRQVYWEDPNAPGFSDWGPMARSPIRKIPILNNATGYGLLYGVNHLLKRDIPRAVGGAVVGALGLEYGGPGGAFVGGIAGSHGLEKAVDIQSGLIAPEFRDWSNEMADYTERRNPGATRLSGFLANLMTGKPVSSLGEAAAAGGIGAGLSAITQWGQNGEVSVPDLIMDTGDALLTGQDRRWIGGAAARVKGGLDYTGSLASKAGQWSLNNVRQAATNAGEVAAMARRWGVAAEKPGEAPFIALPVAPVAQRGGAVQPPARVSVPGRGESAPRVVPGGVAHNQPQGVGARVGRGGHLPQPHTVRMGEGTETPTVHPVETPVDVGSVRYLEDGRPATVLGKDADGALHVRVGGETGQVWKVPERDFRERTDVRPRTEPERPTESPATRAARERAVAREGGQPESEARSPARVRDEVAEEARRTGRTVEEIPARESMPGRGVDPAERQRLSEAEEVSRQRSAASERGRRLWRDAVQGRIPALWRQAARRLRVQEAAIPGPEAVLPGRVSGGQDRGALPGGVANPKAAGTEAQGGRGRAPGAEGDAGNPSVGGGVPPQAGRGGWVPGTVKLRVGGRELVFDLDEDQYARWQEASATYQSQREAALSLGNAAERERALTDLGNQFAAQKQHIVLGDASSTAAAEGPPGVPPSRQSSLSAAAGDESGTRFSGSQRPYRPGAGMPARTSAQGPFPNNSFSVPRNSGDGFTPRMERNPLLDWALGLTPAGAVPRGGRAESGVSALDTLLGRDGEGARRLPSGWESPDLNPFEQMRASPNPPGTPGNPGGTNATNQPSYIPGKYTLQQANDWLKQRNVVTVETHVDPRRAGDLTDIDIANVIVQGFEVLEQRGVGLITAVVVDAERFKDITVNGKEITEEQVKAIVAETDGFHLYINPLSEYWADPVQFTIKQGDFFSSDHPLHAIFHEAGHWRHALDQNISFWKNKRRALGENEKVARTVSGRAADSPNELIAESFAAIVAGKTVSQEVRKLVLTTYKGVLP